MEINTIKKLLKDKVRNDISFLIVIIPVDLFILVFLHIHDRMLNLENALVLENIWTIEIAIFTVAVTIMTVLLDKVDKKLYGIELSKIIIIKGSFGAILTIFFAIVMLTFIPVTYEKMTIFNIPIVVFFYISSSSIALWLVMNTIYVLSYPEDYEKSARKFYIDKIISKKDFMMLIEENLCPYMYELIEKRNFGEYNRDFEFLIELFSIIKNDYKDNELLNFMEDKIYEVLKLTEIYLSNLSNLNIKILNDENFKRLLNLFCIQVNEEKEKKILDLARKLSMNIIKRPKRKVKGK